MMRSPDPILVADLFSDERTELLAVLRELSDVQWRAPTACEGWSVKDVAAHLLGGDLGKLSRGRDGFTGISPRAGEDIGDFINRINQEWVDAARRLSPRVLCDLLEMSGREIGGYFGSLDPGATGDAVSWAGTGRAAVWLDVAREYTERWHHQQHIREAVGAPGLIEPRFMAPAIATFVHALPQTYRDVPASEGASVQIRVLGDSGGDWVVAVSEGEWSLYSGTVPEPTASVTLNEDLAWRIFTNGSSAEDAFRGLEISGDGDLANRFLRTVAIIV